MLFNSLLDACCILRETKRLEETLQTMKEYNVPQSAVTLGILVKAYGRAQDLGKILKIWHSPSMATQRSAANAVTYGCMIDACVKCNALERAMEVSSRSGF